MRGIGTLQGFQGFEVLVRGVYISPIPISSNLKMSWLQFIAVTVNGSYLTRLKSILINVSSSTKVWQRDGDHPKIPGEKQR